MISIWHMYLSTPLQYWLTMKYASQCQHFRDIEYCRSSALTPLRTVNIFVGKSFPNCDSVIKLQYYVSIIILMDILERWWWQYGNALYPAKSRRQGMVTSWTTTYSLKSLMSPKFWIIHVKHNCRHSLLNSVLPTGTKELFPNATLLDQTPRHFWYRARETLSTFACEWIAPQKADESSFLIESGEPRHSAVTCKDKTQLHCRRRSSINHIKTTIHLLPLKSLHLLNLNKCLSCCSFEIIHYYWICRNYAMMARWWSSLELVVDWAKYVPNCDCAGGLTGSCSCVNQAVETRCQLAIVLAPHGSSYAETNLNRATLCSSDQEEQA